jgi:alkylated DNA nucleotide flippase Atl1
MRLSKAQLEVLKSLPRMMVDSYPPIAKLVGLGLARKVPGDYRTQNPKFERTPEGDAVLAGPRGTESLEVRS